MSTILTPSSTENEPAGLASSADFLPTASDSEVSISKTESAVGNPPNNILEVSRRNQPLWQEPNPPIMRSLVKPSDCGCGGGENCSCGAGAGKKIQYVYALGRVDYDFGSEARRDAFTQAMSSGRNIPSIPGHLLDYLDKNPEEASSLNWTLNLDVTPIYAIQPMGPFAAKGYDRLREALKQQLTGVELVSVPGVIGGNVRLQSGQIVPLLVPAIRGIHYWSTDALVEQCLGTRPSESDALEHYEGMAIGLTDFLNRVYYDLRNLGMTAEERAINFSATNAYQISQVVMATTKEGLDLDSIKVKKSPVCRPDSECYDVELSFFNPENVNIANTVFRFTVDVSDVIPITIGKPRRWNKR